MIELLSFQRGNAKLNGYIYTFSLPAGHTCPGAKDCLAKVARTGGKIMDGKHCLFRCFSATTELLYTNVRISRWNNFDLLATTGYCFDKLVELISRPLPKDATLIRIHVSGDFFNQAYFDAWLEVAKNNPDIIFYAYTKSIPFWIKRLNLIPKNFRLTASYGGKYDELITKHNLRYAKVVYSLEEAKKLKLKIDHDDSLAYSINTASFALLLHSTQPAKTPASKALALLRKQKIGGYRR